MKKPVKKKASAKKKTAAKKAPAKKPAKNRAEPPAVEKEAAALLDDFDNGQLGNPLDVLEKLHELDLRLPKASSLRTDFDAMLEAVASLAAKS